MMERFVRLSGTAVAMPAANMDTDVIMPKAFLKRIDRSGLADGVFHDLRFDGHGEIRPDFILNHPGAADARFLICGPNFGCGSSREHAVWGLLQYGIRAVIAPSFAGIFSDNAANNGLLLITLPIETASPLSGLLEKRMGHLTIDLERQQIELGGNEVRFEVDAAVRNALMSGRDRIAETLTNADQIRAFELAYFAQNPWLGSPNQ